jgi:TolA-binding protein
VIAALKEKLIIMAIAGSVLAAAGCVGWHKTPPPAQRPARQHVDPKAQQQYYDRGLQYYSQEHYRQAKESFQQVVELGPNTALGVKAQENLKKIDRILRTLEEIESK